MPFNEDGTRKRTMAYKKGPFKMKSPLKNTGPDFSNPKVVETYKKSKKYRDHLKSKGITYDEKTKKSEKILKK